jgi:8-oxo-dGTP pyrophosphatase MutT (NUDIX family)
MQFYNDEYRASKDWPYAISAGTVVYRTSDSKLEILLLQRLAGDFPQLHDGHTDSYHLPKGHVQIGETLEQTALRETVEETGCEVVLRTYLGAKLNNYKDHNGILQAKIVHYFAGEWQRDTGPQDNEHSGRLWVPASKAARLIGSSNPKREDEIVARLLEFLELSK